MSLSNNNISRQIIEMSNDINEIILEKIEINNFVANEKAFYKALVRLFVKI